MQHLPPYARSCLPPPIANQSDKMCSRRINPILLFVTCLSSLSKAILTPSYCLFVMHTLEDSTKRFCSARISSNAFFWADFISLTLCFSFFSALALLCFSVSCDSSSSSLGDPESSSSLSFDSSRFSSCDSSSPSDSGSREDFNLKK